MFKEGSFEKTLGALGAVGIMTSAACVDMTSHPAQQSSHEATTPRPKETLSPRQEMLQKGLDEVLARNVPNVQVGNIAYELREGVVNLPASESVHIIDFNARPFTEWNGYSGATGSVSVFLWNKETGFFSYITQMVDKNIDEMENSKHFTFITAESSDMEFILSGNATFAQDIEELQVKNILTLRSKNWTPNASNYSSNVTGDSAEFGKVWEKWTQFPSSRLFRLTDGKFIDLTPEEILGDEIPVMEESQ